METEQQQLQKTPSTIYFVEVMKPEYVEYIDSCKIRAQTDSEYWQTLKDSMSRGMIQLDNNDENNDDNVYDNSSVDDKSNAESDSTDTPSVESMRSLLEYQIKMLENMNYAIDLLTEKCDELTKYCAKLASRLKKYGVDNTQPSTIDINGITNSNNKNEIVDTIIPVKETSISLKHRVHTDDSVNDTDSLEESTHDVETVEV